MSTNHDASAVDTAKNSTLGKPFKKGQSGNPAGRPKGARNKLSEAFLSSLADDFAAHGQDAIKALRVSDPKSYLQIIAAITAKLPIADVQVNNTLVDRRSVLVVVDHGSDDEWEAKLRAQQDQLTRQATVAPHDEVSET